MFTLFSSLNVHFYAAPGENFDAAPAPTLLYIKTKHFKGIKVIIRSDILFFFLFCIMKVVVNANRKNIEIIQFVPFKKKTIHAEHHFWSRLSWSRIALLLRFRLASFLSGTGLKWNWSHILLLRLWL
jgi:predicted phosphohydrolase